MRAAQGQRLDWKEQARCRDNPDVPKFAWTVVEGDTGPLLLGRKPEAWIAMALMICQSCPAQYGCARFAVAVDEKWGTWAMPLEHLKRLKRLPAPDTVIDVAEDLGVSVQVAVDQALRHA